MNNTYCILFAGGKGTRLWPFSTAQCPKQFLDLLGVGQTMLQITYERYARFVDKSHIYVVCNEEYQSLVTQQLPQLTPQQCVTEPVRLGTLPAAVLTSMLIYSNNHDATVICAPCDQLIFQESIFQQQMMQAVDYVTQTQSCVAVGVKATSAETAYGYLQKGAPLTDGLYRLKGFTEKPTPEYAQTFLESGEFAWSTGLFVCRVKSLLDIYCNDKPEMLPFINNIATGSVTPQEIHEYTQQNYARYTRQNLDLYLLDHARQVAVLEAQFGWSDLGTWGSLYQHTSKDAQGNAIIGGQLHSYNSQDNIVSTPANLHTVIKGLEGYLVALQGNTLVIIPKNDASLLRRVRNDLKITLAQ